MFPSGEAWGGVGLWACGGFFFWLRYEEDAVAIPARVLF